MIKRQILMVLIFLYGLGTAFAWDDKLTHRELTKVGIEKSNLDDFLKDNLCIGEGLRKSYNGKTTLELLQDGSRNEDISDRALNHFHNPIQIEGDEGLQDQGCGWLFPNYSFWAVPFCDFFNYFSGLPNRDWAIGQTRTGSSLDACGAGHHSTEKDCNDYSWRRARDTYYEALVASSKETRDSKFIEFYEKLGRILHLLQDVAVPAHTRNDMFGHLDYTRFGGYNFKGWGSNLFEYWVKMKLEKDRNYVSRISSNTILPVFTKPEEYWDRDVYKGASPEATLPVDGKEQSGLAEYSNANFLSRFTIFTEDLPFGHRHYFPYPRKDSIEHNAEVVTGEDGKVDVVLYGRKYRHGEVIDHFVRQNWCWERLSVKITDLGKLYQLGYQLDDNVHEAYAEKLIPKAVGYTAGLINYFFRGDMHIRKASVRLGTGLTIAGIDCEVKNATFKDDENQIIEPFESGTIDISCQYFLDGQEDPNYSVANAAYTISDGSDLINSDYVPISVTFPEEQIIPFGAKDMSFTLVFKGKLGNEEGAVAARQCRFYSRIAYSFQPGGAGNESNIYTILPDGSDGKQITTDAFWPNLLYSGPTWSPGGTKMAFCKEMCTDPNPDGEMCSGDFHSEDIVVIDLTAPNAYPGNVIKTLHLPEDSGYWLAPPMLITPSFSPDGNQLVAIATDTSRYAMVVFDIITGDWRYVDSYEYWMYKNLWGSPPAWSPKGDKIAYHIYKAVDPVTNQWVLHQDICLINPDGTGNLWLTNDEYTNAYPSWSPDGEWILFVSNRDGEGYMDIWIMDSTGNNKQKIRDCDPDCWFPSFSPDGLKIAFKQGSDIYTINIDGSGLTQVTSSGYYTTYPVWSPVLPEPSEP